MKKLETGVSTEIVNGRVEVYTEKETLQIEQSLWWENLITNEQFERIMKKLC